MDIHKHIVDQRIRKIVSDHPDWFQTERDEQRKVSKSFLLLAASSYLGMSLSETIELITEGGGDGGVDAIHIGRTAEAEFSVTLFQAKYKTNLDNEANFPANAVLTVVNAIRSIFDPSKQVHVNEKMRYAVAEIHSLIVEGYIPKVKCVMVNNGLSWNDEGKTHIANAKFPSNQVSFEHYNHQDMIEQLQQTSKIKDTIQLAGKSFIEDFPFKRVIVGKISVAEIAQLLGKHGDALLEKNIRNYLRVAKNHVNQAIQDTLQSDKRHHFYFFNNGITMVCSKFSHNGLMEGNWPVVVTDMQIINGGQTCKTIQRTVEAHPEIDFSKVFVLLRLYELSEDEHDELLADITLATNSQNPVSLRDLRANDPLQKALASAVQELGYTYVRKRDSSLALTAEHIPSTVAAEAIYAVWKRKPHVAKFRELFGRLYEDVFENVNGAQLILAVLIFRYCDSQRKKTSLIEQHPHLPYSHYVLAMMIGNEILQEMHIKLDGLNHRTFAQAKELFSSQKDAFFTRANEKLTTALHERYGKSLNAIELRRLAAAFRRSDLLDTLEEMDSATP